MKKSVKKIFSWLLTLALVLGMIPLGRVNEVAVAEAANVSDGGWTISWNADDAVTPVATGTQYGNYTVTNGGSVAIDGSARSLNGQDFTHRLKTGGTGSRTKACLSFTAPAGGKLTVYAAPSSDTATGRSLVLDGPVGTESVLVELSAGAKLTECTWNFAEAGDYYLYSDNSGINIQYISYEMAVTGTAPVIAPDSVVVTLPGSGPAAVSGAAISWDIATPGDSTAKILVEYKAGDADWKTAATVAYDAVSANHDIVEIPSCDLQYRVSGLGDTNSNPVNSNIVQWEQPRADWSGVLDPTLSGFSTSNGKISLTWNMVMGRNGADELTITMLDASNQEIESTEIDAADVTANSGTVTFQPEVSGNYTFKAIAKRNNEVAEKTVTSAPYAYTLPLATPIVYARTAEDAKMLVSWENVSEATSYTIEYEVTDSGSYTLADTVAATGDDQSILISGLSVGITYTFKVTAIRAGDSTSATVSNTLRGAPEREWKFTYFGTSTNATVNKISDSPNIYDGFSLLSCSYNAQTGVIGTKGGKFVGGDGTDGISYYYTQIDAANENFELTATFTVDYIAPAPDGQEGFALLIRDALGTHGGTASFFSNSAAAIATKVEWTDEEYGKITLKDGLAARFVTGITSLSAVPSGHKHESIPLERPTESGNIIQTGESYTFTVKKTNTGYHVIYTDSNGDELEEILYGPEELLKIDTEHVYVGFAAARGCNVTVSDISFSTSNPLTDPPPITREIKKVKPSYTITSPKATGNSAYEMVFLANADGKLTIKKGTATLLNNVAVTANDEVKLNATLARGNNNYQVSFTPNSGYKPSEYEVMENYNPVSFTHTVSYKTYGTASQAIYVSPSGTPSGTGSKIRPLDIYTAVKYVQPGQTILLEGGIYHLNDVLKIDRGIDGTDAKPIKMILADKDNRAIFDFSNTSASGAAFQLWGAYWYIQGIDICNTPDKVKGLQVSGYHCTVDLVNAYNNGDTGIQVSGTSAEGKDKWPSNNLILNCTSYNNADRAMEDADGFAAKLTSGDGNVFRGCIAYNNADDGWDLFSKTESGTIGSVWIDNCVTFRNGYLLDDTVAGNGNGFKMGGTNMPGAHVLTNSISYDNKAKGIDSNSCPDIKVYDSTSYNNESYNMAFYTNNKEGTTAFVADGILSYKNQPVSGGNIAEEFKLYNQASLNSAANYFYDGSKSKNISNVEVDDDWFVSLDTSILPERDADGSINMNGLLELTGNAALDAGARLQPTPSPVIVIPAVITDTESSSDDSSGESSSGTTSTSQEKAVSVPASEKPNVAASANDPGDTTGEWKLDGNGWWYQKKDSSYPADSWLKVNGQWYMFGKDGYMKTGWQQTKDGSWFYFDDKNGNMATGWKQADDGKWYFLDTEKGEMASGWLQTDDGKWYLLDTQNGDMKTGWVQTGDGKWYFLDTQNGDMKTGWLKTGDGKWYFLNKNGDCAINTTTPDGYKVDENGEWVQ